MSSPSEAERFNQDAWDKIAAQGDRLFRALDESQIESARRGDVRINLTPIKRVPDDWLGKLVGLNVLCLACGGGQQGPLFAAAGANTTVFDLSEQQLERDRSVAEQFNLQLQTVQGNMTDLSAFSANQFDLVVNPCSVCYCPDVGPIWSEVFRITKPGGHFLTGFIKPVNYLFDAILSDEGTLHVRHKIPYADNQLPVEEQEKLLAPDRPIEFGHSLSSLIGQQLEAGFRLVGFYEDRWGGDDILSNHIDVFAATRSLKPTVAAGN